MPLDEEEGTESSVTPLLGRKKGIDGTVATTDWLGRPADDRNDLGGWSCSLCAIGAFLFVYSAFYGIVANLVLYLVDVWGESNAAAASSVTNLGGTTFICSLLGAFISDAYTGRLWGSIIFEILLIFSFLSISLVAMLMENSQPPQPAASKTLFLVSLYLMALASGSTFPSLTSLGADQLHSHHDKAKYFTFVSMTLSAGQVFATTVITYLDGKELWALGFWLCTGATGVALILTFSMASKYRLYRAGGNPLVRVGQVLVSATRNVNVTIPKDPELLHEVQGEMSAIPGSRKLFHTGSLRYLDKAAVRSNDPMRTNAWRLCTVTQVEEVKCLMRVMPVGIASTCAATALAQVSSLFEEQAAVTDGKLVGGLSIASASMQLFSIGGSLLTGVLYNTIGTRWLTKFMRCRNDYRGTTSLQLQGMAMLVAIVAMVVAALVEAHRLNVAHVDDSLISIRWLIPQNFLLGITSNLLYTGSIDFFYNEVSDGMRAVSTSINLLFIGAGSYLSSIFVQLITTITTQDGHSGWISDDLNDGHLDYFYWFLASFLTCSLGLYLLYAQFYVYRETGANSNVGLKIENVSLN